jgi:F-type H+-transporting ATPase subunit gamma
VKDKVTSSTAFFQELWAIYSQLRVDPKQRLTVRKHDGPQINKQALIAVTSEGGLSGDIDARIIDAVLAEFDAAAADLFIIGRHGETLLAQRGVTATKVWPLPEGENVDVGGIIGAVTPYRTGTVFYEEYISLVEQSVDKIELISAVQELSNEQRHHVDPGVISSQDYLFEPSLEDVIAHLEAVMMEIALSQVILESRLAQYASRFTAMNAASKKAADMKKLLVLSYHRAQRSESDERLKEIVNAQVSR